MNDEQLAKLPKWAQAEIIKLRHNVKNLTQQLKEIETSDGPFRHTDYIHTVGIPHHNIVQADVDGTIIEVTLQNRGLRINSNRGSLRIQPQATNVVLVWAEASR